MKYIHIFLIRRVDLAIPVWLSVRINAEMKEFEARWRYCCVQS